MRVSIRAKLVILLTLVALVPLVAALLTIVIGGRKLRSETIGQNILAVTSGEARSLEKDLVRDLREMRLLLYQSWVLADLSRRREFLPEAKRKELDAAWPTLALTAEPMQSVLKCPTAELLLEIRNSDHRLKEVFVTDRFGQLVAATGRTEDFYQADEDWWRGAYADGKGRYFIPPVNYDASSDVWSIDLCVPILDGGEVVGVAKAVLDITGWLEDAELAASRIDAQAVLLRADGTILYRRDTEPTKEKLPDWSAGSAEAFSAGWGVTSGRRIRARCPIMLPRQFAGRELAAPSLVLAMELPEQAALGEVYKLSLTLLAIGIWLISTIFLLGLLLVERSMIRRLRRLTSATRKVADGDLSYRIESPWPARRLLGDDEIDELADDFNRMVQQLERSHRAMEESGRMKTNFLRIASHELRTPVSYILGMYKLMRGSEDANRLTYAVQSMGAKAHRLDEIIQAMFKLLPEPSPELALRYEPVKLKELLEEVYLDCFPFVEKRGQDLVVDSQGQLPVVQVDRDKMLDVLENLVMNAVKFTPDAGVIQIVVGEELGGRVSISVVDQGPGVPQEDLPHLFEPFYSGGEVMQHSTGTSDFQKRGIGLGLAIVKHFVELHGGAVRVASSAAGATFTVTIPIEPPARK